MKNQQKTLILSSLSSQGLRPLLLNFMAAFSVTYCVAYLLNMQEYVVFQCLLFVILGAGLSSLEAGATSKSKRKTYKEDFIERIPCAAALVTAQGNIQKSNNEFELYFAQGAGHASWQANKKVLKTFLDHSSIKQERKIVLRSLSNQKDTFIASANPYKNNLKLLVLVKVPDKVSAVNIYHHWKKQLSYELYTSLSSIQGFAEQLLKENTKNADEHQIIFEESKKMIRLAENFMNVQKQEDSQIEAVEVVGILQQAKSLCEPIQENKLGVLKLESPVFESQFYTYPRVCRLLLEKLVLDQAKNIIKGTHFYLEQNDSGLLLRIPVAEVPLHYPIYEEWVERLEACIYLKKELEAYEIVFEMPNLKTKQKSDGKKEGLILKI